MRTPPPTSAARMRWPFVPAPAGEVAPPAQRTVILLAAVIVLHLVLAWLMRIPSLSWGEDDAAYILLAQQLRHFGYRELQDIAAPIHARFPPGYPFLIALLGWPFGDATDALLAFNMLFTVATVVLLYLAARRHVDETVAVLAAVLFAVNPMSLWDSTHVMAEAPFKFLMMLGLWALTRERDDSRYAVLAGGAIIAAALTRSAGIFLLPALALYWILQRRYRWAGLFVTASLCTVGAWMAWTLVAPEPETRRLYVATVTAPGGSAAPRNFVVDQLLRLPARGRRLFTIVFPFVLSFPTVPGTPIDNLVSLGSIAGLGGAGLLLLVRRWTAAALITVCYGSLLMIWRYAVERFANPLVPFLLVAMLVGTDWLTRRYAPRWRGWGLGLLTVTLLVGASQLVAQRLGTALRCDRSDPVHSDACWDATYRDYLKAARWVADSTPPSAVFFVNKERGFYTHSGRRTINQDRALQEDSVSLAGYLRERGARYTVATRVGIRSAQHNRLLAAACRDFVLLRAFPSATLVLRLREERDPPQDDAACRALATYRRPPPSVE